MPARENGSKPFAPPILPLSAPLGSAHPFTCVLVMHSSLTLANLRVSCSYVFLAGHLAWNLGVRETVDRNCLHLLTDTWHVSAALPGCFDSTSQLIEHISTSFRNTLTWLQCCSWKYEHEFVVGSWHIDSLSCIPLFSESPWHHGNSSLGKKKNRDGQKDQSLLFSLVCFHVFSVGQNKLLGWDESLTRYDAAGIS